MTELFESATELIPFSAQVSTDVPTAFDPVLFDEQIKPWKRAATAALKIFDANDDGVLDDADLIKVYSKAIDFLKAIWNLACSTVKQVRTLVMILLIKFVH